MTPELRSLYEGTVLPLLEFCTQMDRVQGQISAFLRSHDEMNRAGPALIDARAAMLCKAEGTKQHAVLQRKVERLEKKIREQQEKADKVQINVIKLKETVIKMLTPGGARGNAGVGCPHCRGRRQQQQRRRWRGGVACRGRGWERGGGPCSRVVGHGGFQARGGRGAPRQQEEEGAPRRAKPQQH